MRVGAFYKVKDLTLTGAFSEISRNPVDSSNRELCDKIDILPANFASPSGPGTGGWWSGSYISNHKSIFFSMLGKKVGESRRVEK